VLEEILIWGNDLLIRLAELCADVGDGRITKSTTDIAPFILRRDSCVSVQLLDFFPKEPEVEGVMVERGHDDPHAVCLFVVSVELLEKADLRARGGLHLVEALYAGFETERL